MKNQKHKNLKVLKLKGMSGSISWALFDQNGQLTQPISKQAAENMIFRLSKIVKFR
jgi:hypothetical protein